LMLAAILLSPGVAMAQSGKGKAAKTVDPEVAIIKKLEAAGAEVTRNDPPLNHSVLFDKDCTDELLADAAKLTSLTGLFILNSPKVTDKGLKVLERCRSLSSITFVKTGLTKEASRTLATLPHLSALQFSNVKLDAASVRRLATPKSLTFLSLENSSVDDDALEGLAFHPTLVMLTLKNCPIKGSGLKNLHGVKTLQEIDLTGTKVSERQAKLLVDEVGGKLKAFGDPGPLGIMKVKPTTTTKKTAKRKTK